MGAKQVLVNMIEAKGGGETGVNQSSLSFTATPAAPSTTATATTMSFLTSQSVTLERKSDLRRTSGYIVVYLVMEIMKQLSNYNLSASHGGRYPLPSTLLLLLTELTKLFLVLVYAAVSQEAFWEWRPCLKLGAPATCYFVTNLLYLTALPSTSPPLWMVLIQTRTLYTALAYLLVFKREVRQAQLVGCLLVVGSLPVARFSELHAGRSSLNPPVLIMSQVSALLSTLASLVVELLLKNDRRNVVEQQAWLYVWGSLLAGISLTIQTDLSAFTHLQGRSLGYVLLAVVTSALAGLCVPFIIRNLDTIAKDYLAALNNTLLSVLTALLFPLAFTFNHLYLLSLCLLLAGIWLYEKKHYPCCPPQSKSSPPSTSSAAPPTKDHDQTLPLIPS